MKNLTSLNLEWNHLGNSCARLLATVISEHTKFASLNLAFNDFTDTGAELLYASLFSNSSLHTLNLAKNEVSRKKMTEIQRVLGARSAFNTISAYLLGYGYTGKSTLRATIKARLGSLYSSWFGIEAKRENPSTRGLEVDQGVSFGPFAVQIVDFGGQHHYHHSTHHFTRVARALFVVMANPHEDGYQQQIWYWLRLLNMKGLQENARPEVIVVFSHKDLKDGQARPPEIIIQELQELKAEVVRVFYGRISIAGWIWANCLSTSGPDIDAFLAYFRATATRIISTIQVVLPDPTVPARLVSEYANQILVLRSDLEARAVEITGSAEEGPLLITKMLESHDLLSIKICPPKRTHPLQPVQAPDEEWQVVETPEPPAEKEYLCVNLQEFGREILSQLINPEDNQSIVSLDHLKALFPKLQNQTWFSDLPLLLESLHLCFPLNNAATTSVNPATAKYLVPCVVLAMDQKLVEAAWREASSAINLGRRLRITDEREMFHPAFLPQAICAVLSAFPHDDNILVWHEGVIFKTEGCLVSLHMQGAFTDDEWVKRVRSRVNGEPNRLQNLDLLVVSQRSEEEGEHERLSDLLKRVMAEVVGVANRFWNSPGGWQVCCLLPSAVRDYFLLETAPLSCVIPLPAEALWYDSWPRVREYFRSRLGTDPASLINCLHIGAQEGDLELLKEVFPATEARDGTPFDPNTAGLNDMTPIMMATVAGHRQAAEFLLAMTPNPAFLKTWGARTCLEQARDRGFQEIATSFEDFQADPSSTRVRLRVELGLPAPRKCLVAIESPERDKAEVLWVEPFSLAELQGLTRKAFHLTCTSIGMQYIRAASEGFEELREGFFPSPEQEKIVARFKPIYEWTWDITQGTWLTKGQVSRFHVQEITKDNVEAWVRLEFFFARFQIGKFNLESAKKVEAVVNPTLVKNFEGWLAGIRSKHQMHPDLFKRDGWRQLPKGTDPRDVALRVRLFDHYQAYVSEFDWNRTLNVPVIGMIQATTRQAVNSIFENGFAAVSTLDDGYYGRGIYFTRDLDYALKYGKAALLGVVCPGNVYPVKEHPFRAGSLRGNPCQSGYQSHFTVVSKANTVTAFPIGRSEVVNPQKHADELVVFESAQTLPLFVVYF